MYVYNGCYKKQTQKTQNINFFRESMQHKVYDPREYKFVEKLPILVIIHLIEKYSVDCIFLLKRSFQFFQLMV